MEWEGRAAIRAARRLEGYHGDAWGSAAAGRVAGWETRGGGGTVAGEGSLEPTNASIMSLSYN